MHKKIAALFVILFSFLMLATLSFTSPSTAQQETAAKEPDGPMEKFPAVEFPKDNPQTPEKIELGKKLFFDPRLSKNNKISCNSCHNVMKTGDDGLPRSPGHEGILGGRNSPTVFNAAFYSVQFWDGRAATLEDQAKGPLINPVEMGMANHDVVVDIVKSVPAYQQEFEKVFGSKKITINNLAKAIAAYERTLITPDSAYDRFVAGDQKALSPAAKRGWKLVKSTGCVVCHSGPMFAGPKQALGTGFYQKFPLIPDAEIEKKHKISEDLGRFVETKKDGDKNMWRVSSWRNIEKTAPYFHTGSVATLEEAVRIMAKVQLGKTLKDSEVKDIVAFLKSLTGKFPVQTPPQLPEGKKVAAQ